MERYRGGFLFFGVVFFGGGMLATMVSQPKCGTKVNLQLYVTYTCDGFVVVLLFFVAFAVLYDVTRTTTTENTKSSEIISHL